MHCHENNWKVYLQSLPEPIFILYNLCFIGPWIKSSLLASLQVRNSQLSPIWFLACLGEVFEASLYVLHYWVSSSSLFCYLLCDLQNTSKQDKNWSSGAPSLTIYDSGLVISFSWVLSLISISCLVQSLPMFLEGHFVLSFHSTWKNILQLWLNEINLKHCCEDICIKWSHLDYICIYYK